MKLKYDTAIGSSIGKVRRNNEDNYYFFGKILPLEHKDVPIICREQQISVTGGTPSGFALAVFDGMGGTENGQTASYISAKRFKHCLEHPAQGTSITQCLTDAVSQMTDDVILFSRKNGYQCGTTAVILCFLDDRFYICNVGDSRAFLLRDRVLTQISLDHTDEEMLKKFGITDRKPRLSQYIGLDEEETQLSPFLSEGELQNGDVFLLCSDGLTDMVPEERIAWMLSNFGDAEGCVDTLIRVSLEAGGRDNITIGCVRVTISD